MSIEAAPQLGWHPDAGRHVDSPGNLSDYKPMAEIMRLRTEYLAAVRAQIPNLTAQSRKVLSEYLDAEDDADGYAGLRDWFAACTNHYNGEDA